MRKSTILRQRNNNGVSSAMLLVYNCHNSPKSKKEPVQKPRWFQHLISCTHPPMCTGIISGPDSGCTFMPQAGGVDSWCKSICWAPHTFPFGKREMWFNISVMDSSYCVNVASCPSSIALADLPSHWGIVSLACTWGGGLGGGEKAVGDICELSSLIKELMRFTTWLLSREPIPALTEGGVCCSFFVFGTNTTWNSPSSYS